MWWIDLLLHYFDFKDLVKCILAIFLILVFVSLISYRDYLRRRDTLRWQLRTKRSLDKEIKKRSIDVESADEIITHPSYGIDKDDDVDASLAILDQQKWEERKSAAVGWEANTFIIFAVLLLYLLSILVRFVGFSGYAFIKQMDLFDPEQIKTFLLFIIFRPLLFALAFYYGRLLKRGDHMEQHPQKFFQYLGKPDGVHFITLAGSRQDYYKIQWLIDSIRKFGGNLTDSPITVYETESQNAPFEDFHGEEIYREKLTIPDALQEYPNEGQVFACYHAEVMAANRFRALVWVCPEYLVFNPPELFDLGANFDAALRPVDKKGEGILEGDPLDDYWQRIYKEVGVDDVQATVTPFIENNRIRACYSAHAFAVNPAKGVFKLWYDCFGNLMGDTDFQNSISNDQKKFMNKAILSTLLAEKIIPERTRILPPKYSYPFHLHAQISDKWRKQNLDDLVSIVYKGDNFNPYLNPDINISRSLRRWLSADPN